MSILSQLEEMQWKQLRHDEFYHKDIWLLTVQQRITHMVLHLSKYSSKLMIAALEENKSLLQKTTIDALIIVFSSANIFNKLLCDIALKDSDEKANNIDELARALLEQESFKLHSPSISLSAKVLDKTGRMCKVVESLDHLESVSFRDEIIDILSSLFRDLLALSRSSDIEDIAALIGDRLFSVEQKNPYFKRLGNYKIGY